MSVDYPAHIYRYYVTRNNLIGDIRKHSKKKSVSVKAAESLVRSGRFLKTYEEIYNFIGRKNLTMAQAYDEYVENMSTWLFYLASYASAWKDEKKDAAIYGIKKGEK